METALLVIDAQESFRRQPSWSEISAPDIAERIGRLVSHARAEGEHVIWVLHSEPGTGTPFDPARELVEPLPGLQPTPGEPILHKTSHNAFTTTNLGQLLTERGISRLRLSGIRTEQCVETTARLASDLGYEAEVVLDATATHPLPLADRSGVLSPQEVIERTAAALSGRFATLTTVEQVVSG